MTNAKTMKAAAYSRVSTLLGQDPELQLIHIREYCRSRGIELVKEFTDAGVSGNREKRPGLDAMLTLAKQGKIDVIIISALDRIGRNATHFLRLIQQLDACNVRIISLRENLDFTLPASRIVLTVLMLVCELERNMIATRIKEALAAKKLVAEKTGNGWRCGRKVTITEQKIAEIRTLRETGLSIRQIARRVGVAKSSVQKCLSANPLAEAA